MPPLPALSVFRLCCPQELASGSGRELSELRGAAGPASGPGAATKAVEAALFQMASGLSQLKKLVDTLGTPKDTVEHRHKIASTNTRLQVRRQQRRSLTCGYCGCARFAETAIVFTLNSLLSSSVSCCASNGLRDHSYASARALPTGHGCR